MVSEITQYIFDDSHLILDIEKEHLYINYINLDSKETIDTFNLLDEIEDRDIEWLHELKEIFSNSLKIIENKIKEQEEEEASYSQ